MTMFDKWRGNKSSVWDLCDMATALREATIENEALNGKIVDQGINIANIARLEKELAWANKKANDSFAWHMQAVAAFNQKDDELKDVRETLADTAHKLYEAVVANSAHVDRRAALRYAEDAVNKLKWATKLGEDAIKKMVQSLQETR